MDNDTNELVIKTGFSKDAWDNLQFYSGLKVVLTSSARTWGSKDDRNMTLTGMLASQEVDVSLNTMAHCCDRCHPNLS